MFSQYNEKLHSVLEDAHVSNVSNNLMSLEDARLHFKVKSRSYVLIILFMIRILSQKHVVQDPNFD